MNLTLNLHLNLNLTLYLNPNRNQNLNLNPNLNLNLNLNVQKPVRFVKNGPGTPGRTMLKRNTKAFEGIIGVRLKGGIVLMV